MHESLLQAEFTAALREPIPLARPLLGFRWEGEVITVLSRGAKIFVWRKRGIGDPWPDAYAAIQAIRAARQTAVARGRSIWLRMTKREPLRSYLRELTAESLAGWGWISAEEVTRELLAEVLWLLAHFETFDHPFLRLRGDEAWTRMGVVDRRDLESFHFYNSPMLLLRLRDALRAETRRYECLRWISESN